MPQFGGFAQLSVWFHNINAGPASNSAQANWTAGASEAQQLADELMRNMNQLQQFWTGPAATEFYNTMNTIIQYAQNLSKDMISMGTGLAQMAAQAQAIQPGAIALINAARSNPWSRAAAIAPLNAMINTLGSSYLAAKATHWRPPSSDPSRLPKQDSGGTYNSKVLDNPGTVRGTTLLDRIHDALKIIQAAVNTYQAFKEADFVSDDYKLPEFESKLPTTTPPVSTLPSVGGPSGPDYTPIDVPEYDLTSPETGLAGAPSMGAPPAVSLASGGPAPMTAPGGAMPMGGMGMGMGGGMAAGASPAGSPAGARGGFGNGQGGMFGPGMMGGAGARRGNDEEEGTHTWLTEDDMVWNGDAAPNGVVGK